MSESLNIEEQIDPDTELFSTGILDSVAMMNMITFVEEKARIDIHPADVTLENFDTINRIVALIKSQS
ncbi:acyl carrier protein [Ruegeria halocynthiae]|nr:phosphopantetheine-binding protein [Ruegeria halocynthiae]